MTRQLDFSRAILTAVLAVTLLAATLTSHAAGQGAKELPLPLRLSAFAVNMSNIATGRTDVVDINVTRWTTPDEREALITGMIDKGSTMLMKQLVKMPEHGRMRIPGWQGPDPHQVALGWTLRYAWHTPNPDGGHRIVLGTDRYISMWEAREQPRTIDYPFTLVEIQLGTNGEGVGKASVATKIRFDKKKNVMELENFSSEPVRLQQVKIVR